MNTSAESNAHVHIEDGNTLFSHTSVVPAKLVKWILKVGGHGHGRIVE